MDKHLASLPVIYPSEIAQKGMEDYQIKKQATEISNPKISNPKG